MALGLRSRPKNDSESPVKLGALGSDGAVSVGSLPYQRRNLAKKSLILPVVSTWSPAGPARMPVASVASTLTIFGSWRMGGVAPSGRSSPSSPKDARYMAFQVSGSAASVARAGVAVGSARM